MTTLSDALDSVYEHRNWDNPLYPYYVGGTETLTPYEAWKKLKPEYQEIVTRMIGHEPTRKEE